MTAKENNHRGAGAAERLRFTIRLSAAAYDAVNRLQQEHRVQRGKAIPKWRILDAAVKHYAKAKGIQTKSG